MEIKLFVLLGVLAFCVAAPLDVVEPSISTSVSVSTVTRKVTSRSFPRSVHGVSNKPNDTQPVTEDMLKILEPEKQSAEEGDAVTKPQKIKKKILASNLKNVSEKVVFPGEKHEKVTVKPITNVTETADGGKPNSSDSAEDELIEEVTLKSENMTQVLKNETSLDRSKVSGVAVEGRSLEDRSSEENINVNPKAKTKVPPSTNNRTTGGYSYETFGGLQKVLNNNYLGNNEGQEKGANGGSSRLSPPATLPVKKPPPISRDNSLKNAIRFEGEYYGPTGQTDWVPIIPDKLPVRHSASGAQNFGAKLKSQVLEKSNKTSERNPIVFPSDHTQSPNVTNAIPTQTTVRVRSNLHTRTSMKPIGRRPISTTTVASTSIEEVKSNKSEIANSLPKIVEGSQGWIPIKAEKSETKLKNKTELIVPGIVTINQRNESISVVAKSSTPAAETTSELTTEEATATETTPPFTTLPKLVSFTTETSSTAFESSSQKGSEELLEAPVTVAQTEDEVIVTTIEAVTLAKMPPSSSPAPTTIKEEVANEDDTETLTEIQSTTSVSPTPKQKLSTVPLPTQKTGDSEQSEITSIASSTTPMTVIVTETSPKLILMENVTKTSVSTENSNPIPTTSTMTTTTKTSGPPKLLLPHSTTTTTTTTATPTTSMTTTTTPLITTTTTTTTTTPATTTSTTTTPATTTSTTTTPATTTSTTTTPATTTTTSTTTTTTVAPFTVSTRTTIKSDVGKVESTEEGIYYKNYIPTTIYPHIEITEENVPAYLRLTVQAKDWEELCRLKEDLRDSIIKMLGGKNVSAESVHFLNLNERNCLEKISETREDGHNGTMFLPVNMFLMDKNGDFDKNLSEAFLTLWGRRGLDFELPIRKVDFVTPITNITELADPPMAGSVVAAIVISCVAGICVILLGILFVIMKRRQKRFNYGQRCTPVSLDAYSLDSVSIYNSVRRKGMRASKRSYGNAAFDDPELPTHPMNFAGLANFSSDKDQLYEEFNIIPQVYPKVEELPAGAETKNRYANIIPLPETRVHLSVKDGDPLSDYINANYVRGLKGAEKLYIACQAPMESTVEDFWRMVWEQQCKVILMVTDLQENGIEKCADYLPPNEVTDNLRLFGDFQITLKKRDVKEKYIISNLKLKNMEANLWREVTHLWYLGWPDQGVPSEANSLIAFLIEARSQMKVQNGATTSSPVVVHCSPGTGRTGTVIACDLCIREYEQSRMVDIPRCVFNLRRDRAGSVQTKDQYAFIYQVLNVYATKLSGGGIESI